MDQFIRKHENRIHGVLSCFDRMLFRGYLPIMSGWTMAQFLAGLGLNSGRAEAPTFTLDDLSLREGITLGSVQGNSRV